MARGIKKKMHSIGSDASTRRREDGIGEVPIVSSLSWSRIMKQIRCGLFVAMVIGVGTGCSASTDDVYEASAATSQALGSEEAGIDHPPSIDSLRTSIASKAQAHAAIANENAQKSQIMKQGLTSELVKSMTTLKPLEALIAQVVKGHHGAWAQLQVALKNPELTLADLQAAVATSEATSLAMKPLEDQLPGAEDAFFAELEGLSQTLEAKK